MDHDTGLAQGDNGHDHSLYQYRHRQSGSDVVSGSDLRAVYGAMRVWTDGWQSSDRNMGGEPASVPMGPPVGHGRLSAKPP